MTFENSPILFGEFFYIIGDFLPSENQFVIEFAFQHKTAQGDTAG